MKPHVARTALALLVAATYFMENLDATVLMPAVPAMAHSFGVAPLALNAGVSAYLLSLGLFIPISGWAAERYGPRRIFMLAISGFTLASVLCGLSQGLGEFVLARVLQGIGGAMMVPVGRLLVLRQTPKHELVRAIAVLTWPALVAPVLGPPLGGLIAGAGDWRWNFWLNLPLGLLALGLAWRWVPRLEPAVPRRFDWLGSGLCGGGLLSLMLAGHWISQGLSGYGAAGWLVLSIILWLLAWRHLQRASTPVFELQALHQRSFAVAVLGGVWFRMSIGAVPFLVPLMLQLGMGYRPAAAGLMLMAVFAGNLLMKPLTTTLLCRLGFRRLLLGNGLLNVLLIGVCAGISAATPPWLIALLLGWGGMARSLQFTALNTLAFADIEPAGMGAANTLFSTVFQLAMGLGVALGALGWRLGGVLSGRADAVPAFHVAFLLVAAVSLLGCVSASRLQPATGASLLQQSRR